MRPILFFYAIIPFVMEISVCIQAYVQVKMVDDISSLKNSRFKTIEKELIRRKDILEADKSKSN